MANITSLAQLQAASTGFINNGSTADASTAQTVVPAVAGKSHYITSISLSSIAEINAQIQDNTGTPVVILGPIAFADLTATSSVASTPYAITYPNAIQVASGKSIDLKSSAAGAISVLIQGYTE